MSWVTAQDNTKLYVKDWGTGRPVILIHGWPLSADSWDEVAMAIAGAGMRAIAYDRRGFGRSDQPWAGYNYDTLADDLAAVIKATDAQNASIIGFSMGGGEVARYLSRHQGKNVQQAGLIASIVPYMLKTSDNPNGVPQATFDQMTAGIKKDRPHFFSSFFHDFFGVGLLAKPVSEEMIEWACDVAMQASFQATLACANAFATTDFRADLTAFSLPTLIIHGTQDQIVPIDAAGREVAKTLPKATYLEYEGAPHGLFATHKERLIDDLLAFLFTTP